MAVDVLTELLIKRPVAEVAAFAVDPSRAPEWYVNIKSVEWEASPPLAIGSRIAFVAQFRGRRRWEHEDDVAKPGRARRLLRRAMRGSQ